MQTRGRRGRHFLVALAIAAAAGGCSSTHESAGEQGGSPPDDTTSSTASTAPTTSTPTTASGATKGSLTPCPPVPEPSEIRRAEPGPFSGGDNLVHQTGVVTGGHAYTVWAGGSDDDRTQGFVVVFRLPDDVCNHPEDEGAVTMFNDPKPKLGPLRMTTVEGSKVRMTRSDGSAVSFDVATSSFA